MYICSRARFNGLIDHSASRIILGVGALPESLHRLGVGKVAETALSPWSPLKFKTAGTCGIDGHRTRRSPRGSRLTTSSETEDDRCQLVGAK